MRKEFVDKNKVDKERRLEQQKPVISIPETSKKGMEKSKKEMKAAIKPHSAGRWTTLDKKESK